MRPRLRGGIHPRIALGLERARLAIAMGKWRTARALLEDHLAAHADDLEALSLHGLCLARTGGDLESARQACQRAIDAQPFVARHRTRLAAVYAAGGLERRAAACTRAALGLDPAPVATDDARTADRRGRRFLSWLRLRRRRASRPLPA